MPVVVDQVDASLFQQQPPRLLPPFLLLNLLGEYLLTTPLKVYIDPVIIGGLVGAIAAAALRMDSRIILLLILLILIHLGTAIWKLARQIREDMALLKYGIIVRAHILHLRLHFDAQGQPAGAFLDCAIPIRRHRTSVGSVWLADAAEAARLAKQGRVTVICLVRAPGTWRLLESTSPEFRYGLAEEN